MGRSLVREILRLNRTTLSGNDTKDSWGRERAKLGGTGMWSWFLRGQMQDYKFRACLSYGLS